MTQPVPTFLDYLEAFNRKERFFLVAYATGSGRDDVASFKLSPQFRADLDKALGIETPEDAVAFMDYHFDWLHAAAVLARSHSGWPSQPLDQLLERVSTGNQEDIDLVVAFTKGAETTVVLLEAKAETGWTNKQLASKVKRLKLVFGDEGTAVPGVRPIFCLTSPLDSKGLDHEGWPTWTMRNGTHLHMRLPVHPGRASVFGSDGNGKPSGSRNFWHVKRRAD